ncbi:hypothetical protein PRIPAC_97873 [Pristionchus pacificus]|uniref:Uncharacterized protein n=1 Tax=Pristionchus pacificus TaxID=54126 RepID=A0A2A6BBW4_PRIPA|nr:hypothetical protein PRIPAC_97873 [Pristionchus pacificus]|eukprot:PDM63373.1 hypothetical protein PRIPAC_53730 [Pristionchus pacificus]
MDQSNHTESVGRNASSSPFLYKLSVDSFWQHHPPGGYGSGFSHPGISVTAVVLGTEMMGPKFRSVAAISTVVCTAIGQCILLYGSHVPYRLSMASCGSDCSLTTCGVPWLW